MNPTKHEIEVLEMMNGDRLWERGAWVNACFEFLQEMGSCSRSGVITEKGKEFLRTRNE